jgi:hypothetical protein
MLLRIEGRQLAEEFADAQFCKGMVLVHVHEAVGDDVHRTFDDTFLVDTLLGGHLNFLE